MANKKIGDRVTSTNINATPVTQISGTVIEVEYNGIDEATFLLVDQDDGKKRWWGA